MSSLTVSVAVKIHKDQILESLEYITINPHATFDPAYWCQLDIDRLKKIVNFLKREVK